METVQMKIEPLALMLMFAFEIEDASMTDVFKKECCTKVNVFAKAHNRWALYGKTVKEMFDQGIVIEISHLPHYDDDTDVDISIPCNNYYPRRKEIVVTKELFDFVMQKFVNHAFIALIKNCVFSYDLVKSMCFVTCDIPKKEIGSLPMCSHFSRFTSQNEFDVEIQATEDTWRLVMSYSKDRF